MGIENVHMMNCGDGRRRAHNGSFGAGGASPYVKTADYTIVQNKAGGDAGKVFSNRGASGAVNFTLPTCYASGTPTRTGTKGFFVIIEQTGAANITVTPVGGAKINNGTANTAITLASSAPGMVFILSDGTDWFTSGTASATSSALIAQATVTVTNAQIKALRATPKTLVAAPGAGLVLEFVSAQLKLVAGANVLTESTANLGIKYTNGSGVQVSETIEATGFIDQAANTVTNARPKLDAIVAYTGAANQALVLHNLGAGEIAGNAAADATMVVVINYRVITL